MHKRHPATGRIEFTCDAPTCAAVVETECITYEGASRVARGRGWAVGPELASDLCPRHHAGGAS